MGGLRWEDVQEDWDAEDGTLRDVFLSPTTPEDWRRVRDLVSSRGWRSSYSEDGRVTPMPKSVREIVERRHDRMVLWQIRPDAGISIHCNFFAVEEIEFDISVHEIVGQHEFDVVCDFVSSIGRALQKTVAVTIESAHDLAIMRYDPVSDVFVRVPTNT
jgi:hypothetical protein